MTDREHYGAAEYEKGYQAAIKHGYDVLADIRAEIEQYKQRMIISHNNVHAGVADFCISIIDKHTK